MMRVNEGNLVYFRQPLPTGGDGFVWAAFGRLGGVSDGAFASLNVGFHVGDDSQKVAANRRLIAEAIAAPLDHQVAAQQVHGSNVAVVGQDRRGIGSNNWDDALPDTDAMVTAAKQTYLMVVVADCAVLTFFDPVRQVVGVAHCGWRGMVAKLGQKTVETMCQTFGCLPRDMTAIVSPSIGPCCYEVGEAVLAPLREAFPAWQDFVRRPGGKTHLDLWEMARWQALDSGIKAENVHVAEICTACHTDLFYSHRAENGNTGRSAVIAGMR